MAIGYVYEHTKLLIETLNVLLPLVDGRLCSGGWSKLNHLLQKLSSPSVDSCLLCSQQLFLSLQVGRAQDFAALHESNELVEGELADEIFPLYHGRLPLLSVLLHESKISCSTCTHTCTYVYRVYGVSITGQLE